jgi:sortase B
MEKRKSDKEKKSAGKRGVLLNIALVICVLVLLVSGYKLIESIVEYNAGSNYYDSLGDYVTNPEPTPTPPETPSQPQDPSAPAVTPTPAPTGEEEFPDDDVPPPEEGDDDYVPPGESAPTAKPPSYVDNTAPNEWPTVDFTGLSEINPDVAAWIRAPGTNIDYPVVNANDYDYYLNHLFDGRVNKAGTLFIDYRNKPGFTDRNTIIYGHNMRNHSMFWTLTRYKTEAYYTTHRTMMLITPEGNYYLAVFAAFVASPTEDAWRVPFLSDDDFSSWVAMLRSRSSFQSDVSVVPGDKVVTLSTCSYEYNDARYVVYGKLLPQTAIDN